jgi:hypothetical protein
MSQRPYLAESHPAQFGDGVEFQLALVVGERRCTQAAARTALVRRGPLGDVGSERRRLTRRLVRPSRDVGDLNALGESR